MKRIDIITGASSGIGAEFARQYFYKSQSDEMWLIARRGDRLESLATELNGAASAREIARANVSANAEALANASTSTSSSARANVSANASASASCAEKTPPAHRPHVRAFALDISGKEGVARFKSLLEKEAAACAGASANASASANAAPSEQNSPSLAVALLFNNAGFGTYGTFAETSVEREMEMIDLNCTALTGLCGVCLPYMTRGSVILNTSSLAAFLPLGNFAVYAATKSYVLSFSYALAAELKERGIHVCALCPGSVSTEFANVASNGARKEVLHGKSVEKVVRHAIASIEKKKHAALAFPKWRFTAFASRFVGRYLCAWYTYKFNKRPHQTWE